MFGSDTMNKVFVLRKLTEKFRVMEKKLFLVLIDLETAFNRVPRKVIWYDFRKNGVPEYLAHDIISLCNGCKTAVFVNGELLESFHLQFWVHQKSALSSLLFITVMGVLTEDVKNNYLLNLLYAVW